MRSSTDLLQADSSRFARLSTSRSRLTPTGTQSKRTLTLRRLAMSALTFGTYAVLATAFATIISVDGWSIPEIVMFVCFMISAPWIIVGFWNALIGFVLLRFTKDPVALVAPCVLKAKADDPIEARTAIVMCVRHENADRVVRRLDAILQSVDATGFGDRFDMFVLSDSSAPAMIADEEAAIAEWRGSLDRPERVTCRRRTSNEGFKAGNVRQFVERWGDDYEFMVTLDADSVMSGEAIVRLIRVMQVNPKLGILQSLVVGLPAKTVFARAFQFGMRATMRSYSVGAAWWGGDCGPYWGHNAAIRMAAFRDHAKLPQVPGGPPLGGDVLSHDLYEAVLMRKGGYEVRVLPEEGGSWEDNPATLPEFLRRNRRWCQGNMQYVRLIGQPGLPFVGRVNLLVAILMYVGAPSWILFILAGAAQAWDPPAVFLDAGAASEFPSGLGITLLVVMMTLLFAPKIMGYLDVLLQPAERRRYGSPAMYLAGVATEVTFGMLFAPIVSFSVTAFLIRLFVLRRPVGWTSQNRDGGRISWRDASRMMWPATGVGLGLAVSFALSAPSVLFWAAPVVASFLLAIPFAALTSYEVPALGGFGAKLVAIPEESAAPAEVRAISDDYVDAPIAVAPLSPFLFDEPATGGSYSAAPAPAE